MVSRSPGLDSAGVGSGGRLVEKGGNADSGPLRRPARGKAREPRRPSQPSFGSKLEDQLQAKLEPPRLRIGQTRRRAGDFTKRAAREIPTGIHVLWRVGEVERFDPELQPHSFSGVEVTEQREVQIDHSRTLHDVAADGADHGRRRLAKQSVEHLSTGSYARNLAGN